MEQKPISEMNNQELVNIAGGGSSTKNSLSPDGARVELDARLIKALEDSSKSTDQHNHIMLYITLLMFLIALIQLTVSLVPMPKNQSGRMVIMILALGFLVFAAWKLGKDMAKRKN